ncbi:hypothetical protein [Aquibacillus albus]|uniref:Uncharacterized protein n=1 Tax=Aquibacillus albus TaxID=1168171 RepID=A0ABS2N1X6_9BACI|nr:hypothetical protein [Aquibacillus albus]MBM7572139.1 hypothetical protein [Aquibacillus albus]
MAFGINRAELYMWKELVYQGKVAFLTHYWLDPRFPNCKTVTKVGCSDLDKLIEWGKQYGLDPCWIHLDPRFPHYDLFGERQKHILMEEEQWEQISKFNL